LKRWNVEGRKRHIELDIENASLRRKLSAQQKQIAALHAKEERIDALQEDADWHKKRISALEDQVIAIGTYLTTTRPLPINP
jgi:predicted  nucleic acid-binding Zn-ribbon protein